MFAHPTLLIPGVADRENLAPVYEVVSHVSVCCGKKKIKSSNPFYCTAKQRDKKI